MNYVKQGYPDGDFHEIKEENVFQRQGCDLTTSDHVNHCQHKLNTNFWRHDTHNL